MMSKTVFVVSNENGDEYQVLGIYSTLDKADAIAAYTRSEVSEWELDTGADQLSAGLSVHEVIMNKDGTLVKCKKADRPWSVEEYISAGSMVVYASVWARDESDAANRVDEKRKEFIASGGLK